MWHLQLEHREWVLWGYEGQREPIFVSPAKVVIDFGIPNMDPYVEKFTLPKRVKTLPAFKEFDRVTGWGWRFRTNDLMHDIGWRLAESKEDAIRHAENWADDDYQRHRAARDAEGYKFSDFLQDQRVVEEA